MEDTSDTNTCVCRLSSYQSIMSGDRVWEGRPYLQPLCHSHPECPIPRFRVVYMSLRKGPLSQMARASEHMLKLGSPGWLKQWEQT